MMVSNSPSILPGHVPEKPSQTVVVLVLIVASIGFLFDTYELLMFPVIGSDSIAELQYRKTVTQLSVEQEIGVRVWAGRMLWIAALCGGTFGLLGGWLIDRLGRKTIMIASILAYSLSPVAAAWSTELWQLILFRCTTFIGVCVEMIAAVTWMAELFDDKRFRERAIGWTLATASLGGILVTEAFNFIVATQNAGGLPKLPFPEGHLPNNVAWRFTLLTGLIPGAAILFLMPFVPESGVWKWKKQQGTLKRPGFGELFSPALIRTTLVTTILSACGYAAAFGAIQLTPLVIAQGMPDIAAMFPKPVVVARAQVTKTKPGTPERAEAVAHAEQVKEAHDAELKIAEKALRDRRGNIQRWQELGGLLGRILLAVLLLYVPSRRLLQLFLLPGLVLFPLTYFHLVHGDYVVFASVYFFCGLVTVAQFSFLSELLPRVFPLHLRGTGGSFATNFGGRMIGTMAATLNTEWLSKMFAGTPPMQVATAAGVIGTTVFVIALLTSFFLPKPQDESQSESVGEQKILESAKT
jgi:MFS family permease